MRLLADISAHGLGHLAQSGPLLTTLQRRRPELQLLVRSGLPEERLRERIQAPFEHVALATDFGYRMHDAVSMDLAASAADYQAAHRDWDARVAAEADWLRDQRVARVFSNVSYLPLAGAARAGIPAAACCSLNWADLFAHYFGDQAWAAPIHAQMLAAYRSVRGFLRTTPGMPMADLARVRDVGPLAGLGRRRDLGLPAGTRAVLIAMGGVALRLPVEAWPRLPGVCWLVPAAWACTHPDALPYAPCGAGFTDLLASVDAVLTKPGYGTFAEAACNGVPLLYLRREDWPEQDCLIDWLEKQGRCREVAAVDLERGNLGPALEALWEMPAPAPVAATGVEEAVDWLLAELLS